MGRYFLIEEAILKAVRSDEEANWQRIMMYVSEAVVIDNWMEVRSVIQDLKNRGVIYRVHDVHREVYRLCQEK